MIATFLRLAIETSSAIVMHIDIIMAVAIDFDDHLVSISGSVIALSKSNEVATPADDSIHFCKVHVVRCEPAQVITLHSVEAHPGTIITVIRVSHHT